MDQLLYLNIDTGGIIGPDKRGYPDKIISLFHHENIYSGHSLKAPY